MPKKTDTSIYPPEIVRLRQEALRVSGSCPDEGKWEISPGDLLSTMRFVLWSDGELKHLNAKLAHCKCGESKDA